MNPIVRHLLPAGLLVAALATPAAAQDATNHVSGLTVEEAEAHTVIRIDGDAHPTYSVYQLPNPRRLFIDIADSTLASTDAEVDVDNGVVSRVAAVEYEDGVATVTRVVVGFDTAAHYDVVSEGDDLVVTIDGAERRAFFASTPESPAEFARLEVELEASQSRLSALNDALSDAEGRASDAEAEILREQLAREEAEQARLAEVAARHDAEARADALEGELTQRESELARLAAEREAALTRISELEDNVTDASDALASQEAEVERLEGLRAELDDRIAAARTANANTEALEAERDAATSELNALAGELDSMRAIAEANAGALEQARAEARAAQSAQHDLAVQQQALTAELDAAEAARAEQAEVIASQQAQLDALTAERDQAVQRATSVEELQQRWEATSNEIRDVRFEHVDGVDRVVIEVDAGVEFASAPWADGRAAITFSDAVLPDALRRTLDTQAFDGPVAFVSSYADADGTVHVVADLQNAASELLRQEGGQLVWEFTETSALAADEMSAMPLANAPTPVADTWSTGLTSYGPGSYTMTTGGGSSSPFQQRPVMTRKRITIDLRDADIQNVLRLIADEGNINVVASDDVNGTVTLRLRSVPLDEALSIILRSNGLGWEQEGNIIRVAPMSVFEEEYERDLQRMADAFGLEPLQVRLVPVNYASAEELSNLVGNVLSSRGSVAVDSRNNTLVVTDINAHLETAQELVQQLDSQTPQILIEARIVETNDQFRRQLGIQWGGDYVADQSLGNATGLLFPSTIGIAGGATDGQTPTAGGSAQPNYAVNLPAPAGTGTGGAIGFTFGNLSGSFNLNVRLSAAETQGSAKVISAPRIMTLDNESATITSGVSIPVSVVSAAGAQTVFFDASLTLNVTPRVTPDGNIFLEVQVSKNEPDFENTGSRGDPSIIRREAQTQLLVRDGDTTVIGGIFQRNTGFSTDRVPFFGSLPVIGPLFRNSSRTDVRNELLVFITPRIVNRDLSIDTLTDSSDIQMLEDND